MTPVGSRDRDTTRRGIAIWTPTASGKPPVLLLPDRLSPAQTVNPATRPLARATAAGPSASKSAKAEAERTGL